MRKIELAILDFDDTILHLDVDWLSVKKEVLSLAAEGGIVVDEGLHLAVIANEVSKGGMKERLDEIFLRYEMECVQNGSYRVFPGMESLIKELASGGIKLAIASGNHTETINKILSQMGLLDSFEMVCGRDKVKRNKPDPDQLILILETLGVPKERAVFAGDSLNDEAAAEAAGIRYIKADPKRDGIRILRELLL